MWKATANESALDAALWMCMLWMAERRVLRLDEARVIAKAGWKGL